MKKNWNGPIIEDLSVNETNNNINPADVEDAAYGDIFSNGTGSDCTVVCS